jgi:threonine/homoserine/homoserine lactone efflux protein
MMDPWPFSYPYPDDAAIAISIAGLLLLAWIGIQWLRGWRKK